MAALGKNGNFSYVVLVIDTQRHTLESCATISAELRDSTVSASRQSCVLVAE